MLSRLANLSAILFCLAAVLFLFAGHLNLDQVALPSLAPLLPESGSQILLASDGFADNAVYHEVAPPRSGLGLRLFGSWLGTDATMGRAETSWFHSVPAVTLLVVGYPNSHGCQLYVEQQTNAGVVERTKLPGDDPGEFWQFRTIPLANSATATRFRIVAIDGSSQGGGWLGFSQPFQFTQDGRAFAKQLIQLFLVVLTAAAALVALLFPGLLWRCLSSKPRRSPIAFIWLPLPGFLFLAVVGLLCWIGPPALGVRRISQIYLVPLFAYALFHSLRFPLTSYTTQLERRILLVVVLLASLSISKASYSVGPLGELYGGRISRTLEVGDRSDSRIPYHALQLIATRSRPHRELANILFGDWGFSARTPMVPIAASPVVLALPVHPPHGMPDQLWTVFDPEGFAAYRIVLIVIACCSLIAVFGVAGLFLDEQWAFLAFLVAATTPFVIHETYFTWPKLAASWFIMLAAYTIVGKRFLLSGLLWGGGYLCHPLALFSAPALFGLIYLSEPKLLQPFRKLSLWAARAAALLAGLAICIAVWMLANRHHFSQSGFLSYVRQAGGAAPTPANWLRSRWDSVANTLLPLNLFLLHSDHQGVNSIHGPAPAIVRFYLQYWSTLPFGIGITYFYFLLQSLYKSMFTARACLLLLIVLPFLCFSVYWGASTAGMLREGLQPWILSLLIFSVVMWQNRTPSKAFSIALLLRGVETLLMLLLPAIWTSRALLHAEFAVSDMLTLFVMVASASWLYLLTFQQALHSLPPAKEKGGSAVAAKLPFLKT